MEDPLATTAVPSLLTSACMVALVWRFTLLGEFPFMTVAFFTMLPTLSALACLQDKRFLATFKRIFEFLVVRSDISEDAYTNSVDTLVAARHELLRSFTDRWPSVRRHGSAFSVTRFSAPELSVQQAGNGVGSATGNTSGKSLYDQVRAQLKDHVFPKQHDVPIYFMDPSTGSFLRVNEQHKLVFTTTPDASCLFHVVKGKTHHWGFHSTIYQRYIGQNLVGKVVVNSKKMSSWESFRVLERPEGPGSGSEKMIYLVLCSARFGKGMWVGKHRRTPSNPTDTYLTKNFTHALALVYASDLSAFEVLAQQQLPSIAERRSLSDPPLVGVLKPIKSSSYISVAEAESDLGDNFQVPVLASAERTRVVLPWIEDATSKRFFEMPEKQMVEVVSTTITRFSVREMLEFFLDQDARRLCHEKTSQAPLPPANSSSNGSVPSLSGAMSEWHLHPHFGFVRKLSYRPPTPSLNEEDGRLDTEKTLVPSIAIDQYHSCSVNEKVMQRAVFRSKLYTLSIPHSNCFSVETVFEFQDIQDREGPYALTPMHPGLSLKCRTGIFFTRNTMFAPQIEKGVLEGVKNACDLLLELVDGFRRKRANASSIVSMPGHHQTTEDKTPSETFPPHILAIEVIKAMVQAVRAGTVDAPARARSSLVIQMPWTPAQVVLVAGFTTAHPQVSGFFESVPQAFECVVEETIRGGDMVTPSLVFDVLLSDECSFFHVVDKQSGNMEVDIGAWRVARFPVSSEAASSGSYVRKQLFSMPVSGVPGLEVARIEDYQYYSMQKSTQSRGERLEFGMKIFARDLPDGERFSIEVLVVVEKNLSTGDCELRVLYAIANPPRADESSAISNTDDPLLAAVVHGTMRGLKAVWKRVAQLLQEAVRTSPATEDLLRFRLQSTGLLPSHDELSSKLIEAIAALY